MSTELGIRIKLMMKMMIPAGNLSLRGVRACPQSAPSEKIYMILP